MTDKVTAADLERTRSQLLLEHSDARHQLDMMYKDAQHRLELLEVQFWARLNELEALILSASPQE